MIDNCGGRAFAKDGTILTKIYHKNTNMITICAMAFQMLRLHLLSSVSTAAETLQLRSDHSLTDEQTTWTKPYTTSTCKT